MISRWIVVLFTIMVLAVPLAAQPQHSAPIRAYQIESVNRDVREVLDELFQRAGKQYIIEPGVIGTVTLRISTDSFEQALNRVLQSAGLTYQVERAQAPQGRVIETYVIKTGRPLTFMVSNELLTVPPAAMEVLSRPVSMIASAKLRTVLNMLSQQAGVPIVAAREVPDLEVTRLVLSNVTLGYALNVIAQATKTQYQLQPDGTILLIPAPQIQVQGPQGAQARTLVDPVTQRMALPTPPPAKAKLGPLTVPQPVIARCTQCLTTLQPQWSYCPMCGKKVAKPSIAPRSPNR